MSVTTYYQETTVAEQAQKTWDQSQIIQQFKAGKIKRVRYGYKEVETGYTVYLGACEQSDFPWGEPVSREEYLETQAMEESLSFALDLNDYRDYLGATEELISDELIRTKMHKKRLQSRHLPEEIRRESKIWLAQHEPLK